MVVVDDHPLVRRGLRALLDMEPDLVVVAEAADAAEAVSVAAAYRPDVVLLDVRLPGTSGVRACRMVIDACPSAQVLMLTVSEVRSDKHGAIRAGAAGYLLKTVPVEEVVTAIRDVHSGRSMAGADGSASGADGVSGVDAYRIGWLPSAAMEHGAGSPVADGSSADGFVAIGSSAAGSSADGLVAIGSRADGPSAGGPEPGGPGGDSPGADGSGAEGRPDSRSDESTGAAGTSRSAGRLSQRELEVLRLVAQGMNNREIAGTLFISENTVKKHVRRILDKLDLRSRLQAVVYAVRENLVQIR